MNPISNRPLRFWAWLVLLQVLATLAGLGVILRFLNLFSDSPEFYLYGWAMLPLWFLWGLVTPRPLRPGGKGAAGTLVLWTALPAVLSLLLPDYRFLLTMPQLAAGSALARLWPGSLHSAFFFRTVEPIATLLAHLLLPALLGLGLGWRRKE